MKLRSMAFIICFFVADIQILFAQESIISTVNFIF
jgi:hypothetical protein